MKIEVPKSTRSILEEGVWYMLFYTNPRWNISEYEESTKLYFLTILRRSIKEGVKHLKMQLKDNI